LSLSTGINWGYAFDGGYDYSNAFSPIEKKIQVDPTIGLNLKIFFIRGRLSYSYGLVDIMDDSKSHPSYLNVSLGISLEKFLEDNTLAK